MNLLLKGDENVPDMPLKDSEANHLRLLLGWLRVEYMLDDNYLKGALKGYEHLRKLNVCSEERANEIMKEDTDRINKCPAYVRQAIIMLTRALKKHEKSSGIIEGESKHG